jgi:rod shape-determining protein MreD
MQLPRETRKLLARLAPGVALVLAALTAVLPWSGGDGFQAPLLLLVPIHVLGVERPNSLPPWLVFLVGLMTDVIGNGPLGFWALLNLAVLALARRTSRAEGGAGVLAQWISFAVALGAALGIGHIVATLYHWRLLDWWGSLSSGLLVLCAYPFLAYLLGRVMSLSSGLKARTTGYGG